MARPPAEPEAPVEAPRPEARVPRAETDSDAPLTHDTSRAPLELRSGDLSLRLGMLLSMLADFAFAPPHSDDNGFSATDARLAFLGTLGPEWRFLLQADLARAGPALLDLRLTYQPFEWLRFQAGRFKVGFSAEFMTPAANTGLNNRARAVRMIAPGRSVGLEVGGRIGSRAFFYRVGIFNGNADFTNDDANFLGAARAGTEIELADEMRLTIAGNGAYAEDDGVQLPLFPTPFVGRRILAGADVRLTLALVFLASELLYGRYEPSGQPGFDVYGFHVTAGVYLQPYLQLLFRWDRLIRTDLREETDLLIPSLSFVVPDFAPVQMQLDVEIPVQNPEATRVLVSASIVY